MLFRVLIGALDQGHRFINVEGLGQVFKRTALVGSHRAVEVRVRGHDDHRQARIKVTNLRQHVETADTGHADVGNDYIRLLPRELRQYAIGTVEALSGHALLLQCFLQNPADGAVIVDNPDSFAAAHAVGAPCSSGRKIENAVCPGWLSHSIRPWC